MSDHQKIARQIRWIPTLVILMVLSVMLNAGFWQLERASEKQRAAQALQEAREALSVNLNHYTSELEKIRYRAVTLSGQYLNNTQLLLDNQVLLQQGQKRGSVGYDVLTPFQLDSGKIVLINRGWVAAGESREKTPKIDVSDEARTINGIFHIPYKSFRIGNMDADVHWPRVVQYLDFEAITKRINAPVLSGVVILNADEPDAFQYRWLAVIEGPQKHYSYAVQWFLMSLVLVVLAFRLNRKKA